MLSSGESFIAARDETVIERESPDGVFDWDDEKEDEGVAVPLALALALALAVEVAVAGDNPDEEGLEAVRWEDNVMEDCEEGILDGDWI